KFVHGEEAMKQAEKMSSILFKGDIQDLSVEELKQAFEKVPSVEISSKPVNVIDWLIQTEIEPSKRQAREDVNNGAITINGQKISDESFVVDPSANFDSQYVVARKGKRNYFLAKVTK
ncbi:MAG: tyrosine--tRNA ligase, partial [Limosilactobacillus reuteri]|nr:tyrosine--tRNA ligase [Limosilactobacillus reuteri]